MTSCRSLKWTCICVLICPFYSLGGYTGSTTIKYIDASAHFLIKTLSFSLYKIQRNYRYFDAKQTVTFHALVLKLRLVTKRSGFKSLPNNKILDWSTFKVFAYNKTKVTEEMKFVFEMIENIVGKGENAGNHF